jgi:hypothetical protein
MVARRRYISRCNHSQWGEDLEDFISIKNDLESLYYVSRKEG